MKVLLAPMEGILDHHMRAVLTGIGGYDGCFTEFVRITDQLLPAKVFRRASPELDSGGKTASGVPVTLQLLGGDPQAMAENAAKAVSLGAPAVDINFGCPSKFTTRKNGGSVLLREPERVHAITAAVRRAVPGDRPVSAKLRLGYEDNTLALDNALAVQDAGATFVTVHARTKVDGYRPPARWEELAALREALRIPLIANGDINGVDEYRRCRKASGCEDVMVGRGALRQPDLGQQLRQSAVESTQAGMEWPMIKTLLNEVADSMRATVDERHIVMRLKQWLGLLKQRHPAAGHYFLQIKTARYLSELP